jgi:putative nucleotidyltransferase with HDIG domain
LTTNLKVLISLVVTACAVVLAVATFVFPVHSDPGGLAFWTTVTLVACAAPVTLPRGLLVGVATTPILAAAFLLGPAGGGWVALVGSLELRELRGKVPWYGTLFNHAAMALPAVLAGSVFRELTGRIGFVASFESFVAALAGGAVCLLLNTFLVGLTIAWRQKRSLSSVFMGDLAVVSASLLALAPLAWLMAHTYVSVGAWAALLFALPLYSTRSAYQKVVEVRRMFTQTVTALATAIDARDPKTKQHSQHVSTIAVDIGRVMGCSEAQLEQLEWGGLLHDIGKIGVRDDILLKPDRLNREERMAMNQHPVKGEEILRPVEKLAPELPLIRHHHEWYNGSGYPDRLVGEQIPFLARILHVADAYEAMTAVRPYRLTPLSHEQALGELRKYAGVQFDPRVVEAFARTEWATGTRERTPPPEDEPAIPVLGHVAALRAKGLSGA